jgi:acetyl-CoA C-acetyltransferase
LPAPRLGAAAVKEAIARSRIDGDAIDEVIMGMVVQGGAGQAPARQAAIHGGVPDDKPALTVNKVCGSGLKAVMLGAQAIKAGDAQCVIAGGMESMSNVPHYLYGLRSREDQDQFALESHQKAIAAIEGGKFRDEVVPVEVPGRKGAVTVVDTDEGPRKDTSLEALGKLRPAFQKDGTVTAGNAPGLNDGASAIVVTSEAFAEANGLTILARISGYAAAGGPPKDLFFAPIRAVETLMSKTDRTIGDYDLIEANEAFAVQALADGRGLGWDWDRVNVHGGAVALGHPIGASGARILTTLLYGMQDRGATTGLATLCLGGGNAVALSVERT